MNVSSLFTNSWYGHGVKTVVRSVTAEVLTDTRGVESEWSELAERIGGRFSARPTYALRELGDSRGSTRIVIARRGGRLVGVIPLAVRRLGTFDLARLAGSGRGIPQQILCEDEHVAEALWELVARRGWVFYASSLAERDSGFGVLQRDRGFVTNSTTVETAPCISVPRGVTAKDLRSRRTRKRLRQYRNSLAASGTPLSYETISGTDHFDRRWSDMARVAEASTSLHRRINYLAAPDGSFAHDFLRDETAAGRAVVVGLVVDGCWRAHEIALRSGHRLEAWLGHYDPGFSRWQPGHQLSEWFVDNHDLLDVTELDQGIGVNAIKSAWSNSSDNLNRVVAVPSRYRAPGLVTDAVIAWEGSTAIRRLRRLGGTLLA